MNCCNDFGHCTCANGDDATTTRASRFTCDELGVCQERMSRCGGCFTKINTAGMTATIARGHAFAPGAVEAYKAPFLGSPAQRRALARWLSGALLIAAGVALLEFSAGLIAGSLP